MVRSPSQQEVLDALDKACSAHPEQRVCQVIINAVGMTDPFYVSDEAFTERLEEYATL